MINNMTFGECLKYMLSTLGISINRLSKAINVDSSLVNRWIHGTRIPAYHTPYIESIIEYLSKNIQNSIQVQHLNELYSKLNICEEYKRIECDKEKIRIALLEAQGYSIECKKSERMKNKEKLSKLINNYQYDAAGELHAINETHASGTPDLIDFVTLSNNDKIIFETKNIISYGISLLEAALDKEVKDKKIIYITYNNDLNMDANFCEELDHWKDLLLKALNDEWHILILFRFNNSIDRTLRFINFMLPLLKTGRLEIYYFKKYGTNETEREIYVISGIGALSCFSTKSHSNIDCAFYFENKTAVDILKDYFNVLLTSCSQPLMKYFSQKNIFDYNRYIIENEESTGSRFLFKYCFSMTILPENLYEKLLKRKNITSNKFLMELNSYQRCLDAFLLNIQKYEYRDIYYADSILNLVEHKQYCFYSDTGIEFMDLEAQDIIHYLQNMISLLETYDNYSIAFIPGNSDSAAKIEDYYFLIKERQTVLLGVYEPLKPIPEVRLCIDEPMFVQAFNEYFREIWEHIAPVYKDKKEIILWLHSQIDILNRYLSAG